MARKDYNHIAELVEQMRAGSSDAFAELFAATYQQQYKIASLHLKDEHLASDALQEVYVTAYKTIDSLIDARLFIPWLNIINFKTCIKFGESIESVTIDNQEYLVKHILELPFSESAAIILHYCNNIDYKDISKILVCTRSEARRYVTNGVTRLKKLLSH